MFITIPILMIALPIGEIYLLLAAGQTFGAGWTIILVILTGITGAALMRHEGFGALVRIRTALAEGRIPTLELIDGGLVLIGGVLLLTPGFFTDLLGFISVTPFSRRLLRDALVRWLEKKMREGGVITRRR